MRFLTTCAAVGLLAVVNLAAEPAVQRHFGALADDYRFVQLEERTGEAAAAAAPFGPGLLAEARLESFSRWRVEGASPLLLEVYQLADPSGAYQLFSHWPGVPRRAGVRLNGSEGVFRKAQFVFRVTAPGGRLNSAAFDRIRRGFSEAVPGEDTLPVSVSHLPDNGRDDASVRYYLGPESLASAADFPPPLLDSIGFEDEAEVGSARYPSTETTLFIMAYPTPALARDYFVKIQKDLDGFFSEQGLYLSRSGPLVALLAGPERSAEAVLGEVRYNPTIEWIHDVRAKNAAAGLKGFLGLVASRLIAIGMAIGVMVAAGLVVGVVRYEMIQRFPILTTRTGMIRLDLDKSA